MAAIGIQSLNDDVLSLIVSQLSTRDATQLSLTSRTLHEPAARRLLSSLKVTAPLQTHRFHKFLVEDGGYRIKYLQKLTIYRSNLWNYEPEDGYSPLVHILGLAQNLRALVLWSTEDHLKNAPTLGDVIAGLRDLYELDMRGIADNAIALCGRLTCRLGVVRLKALSSAAHPSYKLDRTTLCTLPLFQSASVVSLQDFALTKKEPLSLDAPTTWPFTHTLYLRNVDPIAIASACPLLAHIQVAFCWQADDGCIAYPHDDHYPYTVLAQELKTRVRVLDTYVDNEEPMLDRTITASVQGTRPVVLSTQFGYGDVSLWSSIADVLKHTSSRTRYLDLLIHDSVAQFQQWLDECLPLLRESNIISVRFRAVEQLSNILTPREYEDISESSDDEFEGGEWDELQETLPVTLANAIQSLQYVGFAYGYMVEDGDAPGGSSFHRHGRARWWRVRSEEADEMEPEEVDSRVGDRLDAYMRSEEFSKTLKLSGERLS